MRDEIKNILQSMDKIAILLLLSFIITEVLLFAIANFLLMKALLLRRRTELGRKLANNNVAMAMVYYAAFFAFWIPILRHPYISVPLRVLVLFTAFAAIREFVRTFGGWRNTALEMRDSVIELADELVCDLNGTNARRAAVRSARRQYLYNQHIEI
jgi:hypothetical protein